jgi:hypothetical protein
MISTDLASIADWILAKAITGDDLGPNTCTHLARVLLDLSQQAARLETRTAGRVLDEVEDERHARH